MNDALPEVTCFCLSELEKSKHILLETAEALPELRRQYDNSKSEQKLSAMLAIKHSAEALWSEFSEILQNLAESEEEQLLQTAKRLFASLKSFDYLGGGDYTALCGALISFAGMLPQAAGIENASKIGRLMNRLKMGYFATDTEHVKLIKAAVSFPDTQVNILDPCCGEGIALQTFTEGENALTCGIEIDEMRCEEARKRLDKTGLGSFFKAIVPFGCFHAVFLNPPYLSVPGPNGRKRLEKSFLSECLPYLMKDALLVYIIPFHRATEDICRVLANNFTRLSVWKFRDSEYRKYKQIAFIGQKCHRRNNPQIADKLFSAALEPQSLPCIDSLPENAYALPSKETKVQYFKGAEFNVSELAGQLKASDSINALFEKRTLDNKERRPLLPMNLSQIGLVGASGMMNGLVECRHPHIIKGKVVKETQIRSEPGSKSGVTEIHEVVSNKLIFNILTPNGYISVS